MIVRALPRWSLRRKLLLVMLLVTVFLGYPARDLDFYPKTATPFYFNPGGDPAGAAIDEDFPRPGRPLVAVLRGRTVPLASLSSVTIGSALGPASIACSRPKGGRARNDAASFRSSSGTSSGLE